jgi:hypothetical protein
VAGKRAAQTAIKKIAMLDGKEHIAMSTDKEKIGN